MNGIIYMRLSPKFEKYIGQTVKPEHIRWKQHVRDAKLKNKPDKYNVPLCSAIRKYGADAFSVVILESGIESQELLNEREEYWIKTYHTLVREGRGGLNVAIGGLGHRVFTEDDFRELYDEGYSIGEISKVTGAAQSTVTEHLNADKFENHRRGRLVALRKNPPRSVSCYTIDTCEKVRSFSSATEAAKYYSEGTGSRSSISNTINGISHSAYSYLWKYDDQPMSVVYEAQKKYFASKGYSTRKQPVVNIETGEVFKSTNGAGIHYNIDGRKIAACCRGERENAGGFHWRYENEKQIEFKEKRNKRFKPVICKETGVIYSSTKEASIQSEIYINVLRDCLKKRTDLAGGLHWEYYEEQE